MVAFKFLGHLLFAILQLLLLISGIEPNPGPNFTCPQCSESYSSISAYAQHVQVHKSLKRRNSTSYIPCCFGCDSRFQSVISFQSHISRFHREERKRGLEKSSTSREVALPPVLCPCCSKELTSRREYLKHLASHFKEGKKVKCPLCSGRLFDNLQKFRVHTTRYHPKKNGDFPSEGEPETVAQYCGPGVFHALSSEPEDDDNMGNLDTESESDNEIPFLIEDDALPTEEENIYPEYLIKDQIARYYLKLESDFILPTTQVQDISNEIKLISELSHHALRISLTQELKDAGLAEDLVNSIVKCTFKLDPVFNVHHKHADMEQLSSAHLREKFWKEHYPFVKPTQIKVGTDANGKSRFAHHVSIREGLKVLLKSGSVKKLVRKSFELKEPSDILQDYTDGSAYIEHMKQHPDGKCMQLLLFQDGFDFDAFGPTQGTYKVNGFYYTLGNLPPEYRSKVDLILMTYLLLDKDMKSFEQEELTDHDKLEQVLRPLLEELEDLKVNGIEFDGQVVPVCLLFLIGDSLGQHQVGGFVRSFTSEFSCRFCPISKTEFRAAPYKVKPLRTPDQYNEAVGIAKRTWVRKRNALLKKVGTKVKRLSGISVNSALSKCSAPGMRQVLRKNIPKTDFKKLCALNFQGVKYRPSPFNSEVLQFHVCAPAMPPCLAHDLFEGIVKSVLAKVLKHFVMEKNWFELVTLNRRIKSFKCKRSDARDAPTPLKSLDKLSGNACENWNLLRLLPFIVGDLIQDVDTDMWQLYLLLKEICEFICAPRITKEQLAYLKILIQTYLIKVEILLPDLLTPKHHFLAHYADLILIFGPLIRLFTLRFESKHVFFKDVVDSCKNFINITKTLAKKYMYRFAYDNSSELIPPRLEYDSSKSVKFYVDSLPDDVLTALPDHSIYDNAESLEKVFLNSVEYIIGDILILDRSENALDLEVGQVVKIILTDQQTIHFILNQKNATNSMNGFYSLDKAVSRRFVVKTLSELPDYYPLPVYEFQGDQCITLKHSVTCMI